MSPTISSFYSSMSHTAASYSQANALAHSSSAASAYSKVNNDAHERSDIALNPMLGASIAGMATEVPSIAQSSGGSLGRNINVYA